MQVVSSASGIDVVSAATIAPVSIPLALSEAIQEGRCKKGDLILMAAFGAGFTWGASLVRL